MASAETAVRVGRWSRLDGIDLLRGLAILLVLLNHVNIRLVLAHVPYTKGLPAQLVDSLFWNGQVGVQIFFVVSGFLITSITLRRWQPFSRIRLRDFYLLRFARIAPLLLLLLAILSGLHFAHLHNFMVTAKTGGLGRALLAALTFHINVLEAHRGYLPGNWDVLWSLSVEEMFYLFFPLLCRILGRGKLLMAILLAFLAIGPFARTVLAHGNEVWREYSYLGSMDAIALGCLTALLVSRVRLSRRALWVAGGVGTAILVFMLGFSLKAYAWRVGGKAFGMSTLALGTALFISATSQARWKAPQLLRPLLALGRNSYEVYLTHMFVVFALFGLFLDAGKRMALVPCFFVGVIGIAGVLGAAVAKLYSEPMNRLLRERFLSGRANPESLMSAEAFPVAKEEAAV